MERRKGCAEPIGYTITISLGVAKVARNSIETVKATFLRGLLRSYTKERVKEIEERGEEKEKREVEVYVSRLSNGDYIPNKKGIFS